MDTEWSHLSIEDGCITRCLAVPGDSTSSLESGNGP